MQKCYLCEYEEKDPISEGVKDKGWDWYHTVNCPNCQLLNEFERVDTVYRMPERIMVRSTTNFYLGDIMYYFSWNHIFSIGFLFAAGDEVSRMIQIRSQPRLTRSNFIEKMKLYLLMS